MEHNQKVTVKKYYTIGETSEICGISVQTLRFYSKVNLIIPAYISGETGYRYYLPEQFQLIDRAKYLQKFGFSLQEIQKIFEHGDMEYLQQCLQQQRKKIMKQQEELHTTLTELDSYCHYFQAMIPSSFSDIPLRRYYEERYVLLEMGYRGESGNEMYQRLLKRRNQPDYRDLCWRFQFCYPLDFDDFCNNVYTQIGSGIFLGEKPQRDLEHVITLPAGEYFCVQMPLHRDDWDASHIRQIFKGRKKPEFVFAAEIEEHVSDFYHSQFIVQTFLG